jgi:hypothetical protein
MDVGVSLGTADRIQVGFDVGTADDMDVGSMPVSLLAFM